jgi:hypothetical protein
MSSNSIIEQGLTDLGQTIDRLIGMQRVLGDEMLKLLGSSGEMANDLLRNALGAVGSPRLGIPWNKSCCDIPEPCWMPQPLGEFTCRVCSGSAATIRLRVTNEDIRPRTMIALASGPAAGQVTFAPSSLPLGPKERGNITASLIVPATATEGEAFELILWLRGCRDYYLRWIVTAGSRTGCCAHEISVCDGPDNILHWYDHFYCPRPCLGGGRQG